MSTLFQTPIQTSPTKIRLLVGIFVTETLLLLWWLFPTFFAQFTVNSALLASEKLTWYLTRSSGTVAYLLLSASTIWGLLLSTKLIKAWVPAPVALTMHDALSWIAVGLASFHALLLLFDSYYTYTLANLLIPFTGPYEPGWVGVGILAFYLMLLLSATFYLRPWISAKRWRQLHYLTFAAYAMVTFHGWLAGTDSSAFTWLYGGSALLVGFLTFYRIFAAREERNESSRKLQPGATS
jgi:predicted ferric reductase